jgi:uncharacterized protein YjbJ (UPF0337 family)
LRADFGEVYVVNKSMTRNEEVSMGLGDAGDKISHKVEEMTGKAKESVGDATDNERLQAEGAAEESSGQIKQAGDDVADALRDASRATKFDNP